MILFIPIILVSTFTIIQKAEFSYSFFIPLIGTLLVGINEELLYIGEQFLLMLQRRKRSYKRYIYIQQLFLCYMQLIFFAGLTLLDVILQLATTFVAGLFCCRLQIYSKYMDFSHFFIIFYGTIFYLAEQGNHILLSIL